MTALETLFAAIDALRAAEDRGSTHWQGCEAVHPRCAVYRAADAARPMAARADAAERLAKAADALPIARAKWAAADDASDIIDAFEAFTVVRKEHEQAADMWRVITEGNEVPS